MHKEDQKVKGFIRYVFLATLYFVMHDDNRQHGC